MICIVGVGVLGTRVCELIAQREEIMLIDHDIVSAANIGRQYPAQYLGMKKVEACRKLFHKDAQAVWKHIDMTTVGLLAEASIVIDCTDNLVTRFVINDFCRKEGIPLIHCALSDYAATVASFVPSGPCLRCVYDTSTGETCTPALDVSLATRAAQIAVQELAKIRKHPKTTQYIHITKEESTPFLMERNPSCPTCHGHYEYLTHERPFYITYCVNSHCMAAKPTRPRQKDHGRAKEIIEDGVPMSIFPNGEIHFHKELDADQLHAIAKRVYQLDYF